MGKKVLRVIVVGLLLCFVLSINVFASSDWDPDAIITILEPVVADDFVDNEHRFYAYNDDTIRFSLGLGVDKDFVLSHRDELSGDWSSVTSSFAELSKSGYEVLKTLGYDDKFFTICILSNIYDESSDVIFMTVNGNNVYDALG